MFRKAPDPREVGERISRLIRRVLQGGVERAGWSKDVKDRYVVELRVVPGGPLATLSVEADAELRLRGDATALGPGYVMELVARLGPLLEEIEFVWTEPVELASLQAVACKAIAAALAATPVRLGIPESRKFTIDAPVLTALGPRDAAWCDAVRADPMRAADIFPWWGRGPGAAERARALTALWMDVPWREPLDSDERELMQRVDDDLRAARKAGIAELPWAAWKEMLSNIGVEDEEVLAKATPSAPIGYRRYDLEVELSGGWFVTMPGSMVGHWEDDGARYWATDGDRALDFSSLTVDGEDDSERLLAVAPEQHAVIARHGEGRYRGRAEAFDDEDVHVVVGLMACAPHVGILTIKGGDEAWAVATWRSLRQG